MREPACIGGCKVWQAHTELVGNRSEGIFRDGKITAQIGVPETVLNGTLALDRRLRRYGGSRALRGSEMIRCRDLEPYQFGQKSRCFLHAQGHHRRVEKGFITQRREPSGPVGGNVVIVGLQRKTGVDFGGAACRKSDAAISMGCGLSRGLTRCKATRFLRGLTRVGFPHKIRHLDLANLKTKGLIRRSSTNQIAGQAPSPGISVGAQFEMGDGGVAVLRHCV